MIGDDDQSRAEYSSPPCFMHELDPAGITPVDAGDPPQRQDVARWRKAERKRLIAERLAIESADRRRMTERIAGNLEDALGSLSGATVSFYWPFRGEPNLRELMPRILARGGRCALPVVARKAEPLVFRAWVPGARLERGVWDIPIPAEGEEVVPDILIIPLVGFDAGRYRLGYGGGYYDRTLAAMSRAPRTFGVGFAQAAIPTIYPQPHDIPMDVIVTEAGVTTQ